MGRLPKTKIASHKIASHKIASHKIISTLNTLNYPAPVQNALMILS